MKAFFELLRRFLPPPAPTVADREFYLHIDDDGWLHGPRVVRIPSPRSSPLTTTGPENEPAPIGVVWHWTAGVGGKGYAERLARALVPYDQNNDAHKKSWHVVISKDGDIFQSVPFERGAWHVSLANLHAKNQSAKVGGRIVGSVNRTTVGIELENAGRLKKSEDGRFYAWPYFTKKGANRYDPRLEVPSARAVKVAGEGYFDAFPGPQVLAATDVLRALADRYDLTRGACGHGHVEYDSPRKEDPGPLWTRQILPIVIDDVFGETLAPVLPIR